MRSVRGRLEGGDLHFLHPLGFLLQTPAWRHRRVSVHVWGWSCEMCVCVQVMWSALLMDVQARQTENTCCMRIFFNIHSMFSSNLFQHLTLTRDQNYLSYLWSILN